MFLLHFFQKAVLSFVLQSDIMKIINKFQQKGQLNYV